MKHVEVEKFKTRSLDYLTGNEPLAIVQDGEVVGHYYPKKRTKQEEVKRAVERLDRAVKQALAETGMTEDEFADLFDLSKPFPYDNETSD
ncbi:MAG: hypothetical protein KME06_16810 [Kastovskya adunca ATA6-11-RM4]|jgi:hypothetical protein|nr:hypothetical protein [Kastovskya adunca ATA6-11-RM4]